MGQPACGKSGHELDIDDKVEQPSAGEDDRIFYECHMYGPPTLCTKGRDPSHDCGKIAARSENLEIFAVFPVGDGRQEARDLGPFDVQQVVDELIAESISQGLAVIER